MSMATKAKSAKARANIAVRMIKQQNNFGRPFDDCFEMGDGNQVMECLIEKIKNDRELAYNIRLKEFYLMPRDDSDQSIRYRQAVDDWFN